MVHNTHKNRLFPSIYPVSSHTDHIGPSSIFVAVEGMREHGLQYIIAAIDKGAREVVIGQEVVLPHEVADYIDKKGVLVRRVPKPRRALAQLSAQKWGNPAKKLKVIGVTGTKGKTTSSYLLYYMLKDAGKRVALITSSENRIGQEVYPVSLTTPQPDYIHMFLAQCVEQDIEWVVLESAAQAFSLHRLEGIEFDAALYTNFAPTHAEFYKTPEEYYAAKAAIINHLKPHAALYYNAADPKVAALAQRSEVTTASFSGVEEFAGDTTVTLSGSPRGLSGVINHHGVAAQFESPKLMGAFNGANIAGAVCVAVNACGLSLEGVGISLATMPGVPGRMNCYDLANGALGVIDKAHTPESYRAVFSTLRPRASKLIVVFGAGGNRDSAERPLLANSVSEYADHIFITDDNPRYEDPELIIKDVYAGIRPSAKAKTIICRDRTKAIQAAYAMSNADTIIAILGKGSEEYELVQGIKHPFSERSILAAL